jgi:polyhydroxyalkanoate synthesis regulator phasin
MSESAEYEEVEISSEGIRVIKRFEDEEFPVPAIAFEFTSGREEEVTVQLSDTVPENIAVEDLGFHPEYGSEHWTIEEGRITFERSFEPEASYTTVYGIRAAGSDDIGQFLTEPEIEDVDPPLPSGHGGVVFESDDGVVESAIVDEDELAETEPAESREETDDEEPIETLDLGASSDSTTESGSAAGADSVTSGSTAGADTVTDSADASGGPPLDTESLVAALADELRNGNVSEEDVLTLQQELVPDETTATDETTAADSGSAAARLEQLQEDMSELRSVTARLDRIQRDVADLRAYTGALEEFLDDHGTGEEIIEGVEQQIDEFEQRLDGFESRLDELEEEVDDDEPDADEDDEEASDAADENDEADDTDE